MRRKSVVTLRMSVALILLVAIAAGGTERIELLEPLESKPKPLPEGTMLKSVDGSVVRFDSNDVWCFEVGRDVNETDPKIPMGTRLALLPSAMLEHLVTDVNDRHLPRYRLTAQVTQYHEANFLWAIYYVPLSRLKDANEPARAALPTGPLDANDVTAGAAATEGMPIPEEIAARLRNRRAARAPQRSVSEDVRADKARALTGVLVDAVGFIESRRGARVFVPNTLGQNVAEMRYELLPCRTLEQAERRLAGSTEPIRLKVAGLVTEYQGTKYLLLQRVIRVYNYGNFGG
jgi:hypothetical protein